MRTRVDAAHIYLGNVDGSVTLYKRCTNIWQVMVRQGAEGNKRVFVVTDVAKGDKDAVLALTPDCFAAKMAELLQAL